MNAKRIAALLSIALLATACIAPQSANAEVTREEVQKQREKKGRLLQDQSKMTDEMRRLQKEINDLNEEISRLSKKFAPQQKAYLKAKQDLEVKKREYHKLIRRMYERGENKYMSILLSADSFNDFLHRFGMVRILVKSDFAKVMKYKEAYEVAKEANKEYLALVNQIEDKQNQMKSKLEQLTEATKKINGDLKAIHDWEDANQDAILEINLDDWKKGKLRFPYTGPLSKPTPGPKTSNYGMRLHPVLHYYRFHAGVDFGGGFGKPIYAAADGVVVSSRPSSGYGWLITIYHGQYNGKPFFTQYAHSRPSQVKVEPGQEVHRGDQISSIGDYGLGSGPHLHFEVRIGYGERPPTYNPLNFIR
ncbi:peptidoglycan DD-metalloendopeptidase family protein [Laceyella sacchari]|jgi:murein DD-endopeptidase MepM/ murein hydrolase activator NlpD|uniref:Peptidoglycan DD-metalloendopeptidase family protein n=1 Tax=Laceyella sacchari TaxID=37482 RepID=A0ABY5U4F6_LACSH|nr:peptidoglycan DD-metalloendopeptidase family protein [Laceyella sacchari]TCW39132.1 murein DD-endopeptidase MepM/ murein hydrolase activator NlpD [Laceyella sacchari]UWE03465.1 peptidoglycan DD-metalloendopeptidase family protein [Laceyella sacchari]